MHTLLTASLVIHIGSSSTFLNNPLAKKDGHLVRLIDSQQKPCGHFASETFLPDPNLMDVSEFNAGSKIGQSSISILSSFYSGRRITAHE